MCSHDWESESLLNDPQEFSIEKGLTEYLFFCYIVHSYYFEYLCTNTWESNEIPEPNDESHNVGRYVEFDKRLGDVRDEEGKPTDAEGTHDDR